MSAQGDGAQQLHQLESLGLAADESMDSPEIEATLELVRGCLRALPVHLREHARLSEGVWDALTQRIVPLETQPDIDLPDGLLGCFWFEAAIAPLGASCDQIARKVLAAAAELDFASPGDRHAPVSTSAGMETYPLGPKRHSKRPWFQRVLRMIWG